MRHGLVIFDEQQIGVVIEHAADAGAEPEAQDVAAGRRQGERIDVAGEAGEVVDVLDEAALVGGQVEGLAAGIAWRLRDGGDVIDAVRFGVAAAFDNLGQLLPARLDLERVRAISACVAVERAGE